MKAPSKEFIEYTKNYWQLYSKDKILTDEDANEIYKNLIGFTNLLIEWDRKETEKINLPD